MAKKGKELKSNFFTRSHDVEYLPAGDRYIFSSDEPKYRFNVIGSGMIGREHMKVTMLEGRGTIHGVYDTNPLSVEKAKEMFSLRFNGKRLTEYDTLEAACNDPEVDGLIICTPNYTHIEIAKEAVKSGKHILTYYEHKYFIDNIEGKETTTATVDEGFWSIVVGVAAEESIKTGKIVHIDELLEENDIAL